MKIIPRLRQILTVVLSLILAASALLALKSGSQTGEMIRAFLLDRKKVLVQETPDFDPRHNPPVDAYGSQKQEKGRR